MVQLQRWFQQLLNEVADRAITPPFAGATVRQSITP
jgi:hypothetical protein